jgi:hypothetical protein
MKIGILSDVHEHLDHLRRALRVFQQARVDRIVLVGDVFETGEHVRETVDMLRDAGVTGVWGNHELGLAYLPDVETQQRYHSSILDFFGSLRPRYELADVLFSHGLPNWDATDPGIYYLGERPWEPGSLRPAFAEFPQRVMAIGHFHRWFLATEDGPVAWVGEQSVFLDRSKRHFVIVHAVTNGWCAVYDTETTELQPHYVG